MTELKQEALQRINKILKTEEHPPGRLTFERLKELEKTARKVASEKEEEKLDKLDDPEILEGDFERIDKYQSHLTLLIQILDDHGLYSNEGSNYAA